LKSNKTPGDSRDGPPVIGKNGTKTDGFYTLSAGGFNIEVNGRTSSPKFAVAAVEEEKPIGGCILGLTRENPSVAATLKIRHPYVPGFHFCH